MTPSETGLLGAGVSTPLLKLYTYRFWSLTPELRRAVLFWTARRLADELRSGIHHDQFLRSAEAVIHDL